ncbi:MAG TPA: TetR/AcrR family transcriptional regulator [Thermoanaerobaculia bacterium]|nr:TetR/AcrR family transcriptional regulator [Thermoanaerobaculia bacterium]
MKIKTKEEAVEQFRITSIQEAAMKVIARKGYELATMNAIAEEAGVAKGTIYLYFESREDLLKKTGESAFGELNGLVTAAIDSHPDLEGRLGAVVRANLGFFEENREFFRIYLAFADRACEFQKRAHHPLYRDYLQTLTRLLEDAIVRNEARKVEPHRAAVLIGAMLRGMVLQRLADREKTDLDADVEFIVSVLLNGLEKVRNRS